MSKTYRPHASFANVVSVIALFVALGGSAYAIGLKKDSVKSKHIVDGQVKAADVADDDLTGADLQEATLDAGQLLARLLTADGAGSGLDADLLGGIPSAAFLQVATQSGGDLSGTFADLRLRRAVVGHQQLDENAVTGFNFLASEDFTFDPPSLAAGACAVANDTPGPALEQDAMTLAFRSGGHAALDLRPARPTSNQVQINVCNTDDVAVDSQAITIEYVILDR